MPTIADHAVQTLIASGVRRVYGLPGDSLNGFTDAIREHRELTWVHTRHEEAAAFAAGAEAALTGELGVCAGSCGPGNLHLINGLYEANRSRVPVLAIAAHIPSAEIGSGYFQETKPEDLFQGCSVYCERVGVPEQMPRVLEIAMRAAIEERGVAVVVVPGDVMLKESQTKRVVPIRPTKSAVIPSPEELAEAANRLNKARKVTILAGAGVEGGHDELVALADKLGAPIVHAMRGKEFVEYDNPFDVGMTGLLGFASGYKAMEECDLLLMAGTDFPYTQFYPNAYTIQIDIRGQQIGRRTHVELPLVGSFIETAKELLPLLDYKKNRSHLNRSLKNYEKTREGLDDLAKVKGNRSPVHPQYLAKKIDELADDDAVFIPDVGTPVIWASRYLTMNGKRRLIGSFIHGTMANAMPQSIGAQAAFPGRQIIALAGDGGLSMLLGDLIDLVQNKLPVKIIVFNNSALSFVEVEMKAAGFVTFGTDLENPSYADVANAMGIKGFSAKNPKEVDKTLAEAFAYQGAALVDVTCARQELSMPPSITAEQAKGFTLYALRTVMNGNGRELVDLADTNVVRRLFGR